MIDRPIRDDASQDSLPRVARSRLCRVTKFWARYKDRKLTNSSLGVPLLAATLARLGTATRELRFGCRIWSESHLIPSQLRIGYREKCGAVCAVSYLMCK